MAAPTVTDVYGRMRAFVADAEVDWSADATLLPYVASAYEDVARLMRASGVSIFHRTSAAIAIAGGVKFLGRTGGATQFPADLLRPLEVMERCPLQSGYTVFVRMSQNEGLFEDRNASSPRLLRWEWKDDAIRFGAGAGFATEVVIEYEAALPDLTSGASAILIQDSLGLIAALAASYALAARTGQDNAQAKLDARAQAAITALIGSELKLHGAMGGRWGTQDQVTNFPSSVQAALRLISSMVNTESEMKLSDAVLLPFLRSAYRAVARKIRAAGVSVFRRTTPHHGPDGSTGTVISLAAGVKVLQRLGGVTNLPDDLLRPLEVMERVDGDTDFLRMSQSEGLFESRALTPLLQEWEWKDDALRFVGASGDVELSIEYEAALPELIDSSDVILIPDGLDIVANLAAAYALTGRTAQDTAAAKCEARALDGLQALIASELALKGAMLGRWGPQDETTTTSVQAILRFVSSLTVATGQTLPDPVLLGFVQMAYADVQRSARVLGALSLVKAVVIPDVPNSQLSLAPPTDPVDPDVPSLPVDFVRPILLGEREAKDGLPLDFALVQPIGKTGGGIEPLGTGTRDDTYRGYYRFNDGIIYFRNTGVYPDSLDPINTTFELTYEYSLPALTSPQAELAPPIVDLATAIAFMAASYVFMGRPDGAVQAGGMLQRAQSLIADFVEGDKQSREPAAGKLGVNQ